MQSAVRAVSRVVIARPLTCFRHLSQALGAVAAPAETSASAPTPAYTIDEISTTSVVARALGRVRHVRGHTKKLSPLARQVAGLSVPEALAQMAFSPRQRSEAVRDALRRAVGSAETYHGLSAAKLMIEAAWTGKHQSSPRIRHHSKMRAGRAHKRTSQLTVRVREMTPEESDKLVRFKGRPTPDSIAKLDPRGY
jgi:ribosomal protein L22